MAPSSSSKTRQSLLVRACPTSLAFLPSQMLDTSRSSFMGRSTLQYHQPGTPSIRAVGHIGRTQLGSRGRLVWSALGVLPSVARSYTCSQHPISLQNVCTDSWTGSLVTRASWLLMKRLTVATAGRKQEVPSFPTVGQSGVRCRVAD